MPDPTSIQDFNARMQRLEKRYIGDVREALADARLAMVDRFTTGPARFGVIDIERVADDLRQQVTGIARQHAIQTELAGLDLAEVQFEMIGRFLPVDFEQARRATSAQQQATALVFISNAPAWVSLMVVQLITELSRLRAAEESPEAITARLFAPDIADGRVSVWRHGANTAARDSQRDLWAAALAVAGALYVAGSGQTERDWRKQAVAVLDRNTTDCCLRVHAQIKPMNEPFALTGTPRYRDEMKRPPFHDFCRTGVGAYIEELEQVGLPTGEMRAAAQKLISVSK